MEGRVLRDSKDEPVAEAEASEGVLCLAVTTEGSCVMVE